jgi:TPR repeat protein
MRFIKKFFLKGLEYIIIASLSVWLLTSLPSPGENSVIEKWLEQLQKSAASTSQIPANPETLKAVSKLEQDCQTNLNEPCFELALIYEQGKDVMRNEKLARELMQRSCSELYHEACYALGRMHESGVGGEKDNTEAELFYSQACGMENTAACKLLGRRRVARGGSEIFQGFLLLNNACNLNDQEACLETEAMLNASETKKVIDESYRLMRQQNYDN